MTEPGELPLLVLCRGSLLQPPEPLGGLRRLPGGVRPDGVQQAEALPGVVQGREGVDRPEATEESVGEISIFGKFF